MGGFIGQVNYVLNFIFLYSRKTIASYNVNSFTTDTFKAHKT